MSVRIDLQYPGFDRQSVPFERLAAAVCLPELGVVPPVNLLLTTDAGIQPINAAWMRHDRPTDVISFPQFDLTPGDGPGRIAAHELLGDLVISIDTAATQASWFADWSLADEVSLLFVHGLLHLCGYDDLESGARKAMQIAEDAALTACALPKPPRRPEQL